MKSIRESLPLTPDETKSLLEIAKKTKSFAERGINAGKPSWRNLISRIAKGELKVSAK